MYVEWKCVNIFTFEIKQSSLEIVCLCDTSLIYFIFKSILPVMTNYNDDHQRLIQGCRAYKNITVTIMIFSASTWWPLNHKYLIYTIRYLTGKFKQAFIMYQILNHLLFFRIVTYFSCRAFIQYGFCSLSKAVRLHIIAKFHFIWT